MEKNKSAVDLVKEKEELMDQLRMERDQIIKEEEIKNKKAYKLSQKLKELKETKDKIEKEIIKTKLQLNKHCTHEKIRTETYHSPGGYLNKSSTTETDYCVWCGVEVDERVAYGHFG